MPHAVSLLLLCMRDQIDQMQLGLPASVGVMC